MTKSLLTLFLVLGMPCLFIPELSAQQSGSNTVEGVIVLPKKRKSINRGDGYNKDGSDVLHSDDPLAQMDRNIIISFHPLSFKPTLESTKDATITQKEQTFIPHVLPITVGSSIYLLNEDQFFHNIYSLTPGSRFNIGRRPPGSPYSIHIKKEGVIKLSCDIHSHMNAIILSLDTPYFTRIQGDGSYQMNQLPDGKYRVEVYHPQGRKMKAEVEVRNGQVLKQNFDLSNA